VAQNNTVKIPHGDSLSKCYASKYRCIAPNESVLMCLGHEAQMAEHPAEIIFIFLTF